MTIQPKEANNYSSNNNKKETEVKKKFFENRQFHVNWANNDAAGWMNYREKYCADIIIPTAIKAKILYESDHDGNVSFTKEFTQYMAETSRRRRSFNKSYEKTQAFIEYLTTYEVAKYLGLTYEDFCNLPAYPDKLRMIFDLGELVHRLINSDIYEHLAKGQDEQRRERAEFRKKVFRK